MKTNTLSGLFGKYVSKDKVGNLDKPASSLQERILVVITGVGVHHYSGAVGNVASDIADLGWLVETIHPLILASRAIDADGLDGCKSLLKFCSLHDDINAVLAIGAVKYGTIGSGLRFAYGSIGEIVSAMVEASASESRAKIMLNQKLCDYLKCDPGDPKVRVNDHIFFDSKSGNQ